MRVNQSFIDKVKLNLNAMSCVPSFEVGQNVKVAIGIEDNRKLIMQKRINGKVVFKSKKIITVQCEHYKECINVIDFITGQARLIKVM